MTDAEFDTALMAAAFEDVAAAGWHGLSIARAARAAGLDLARAHARLPTPGALLQRLGQAADHAALTDTPTGTPSERLFDLLMRRIDVLQRHRAGVLALLRALPTDPGAALLLATATIDSMRWMLQAADMPGGGLRGAASTQGLVAVWLWTVRAWQADQSPDLSATMATLDAALARAAQIARSLGMETGLPQAEPAPTDAVPPGLIPTPGSSFAA